MIFKNFFKQVIWTSFILLACSSLVNAQSIEEKIEEVDAGLLSVESFADFLIDSVYIDEIKVDSINSKQFNSLRKFHEIFGEKLKQKVFTLVSESSLDDVSKMEELANSVLEPQDSNRLAVTRFIHLNEKAKRVLGGAKLNDFDLYRETIIRPEEIELLDEISTPIISSLADGLKDKEKFASALIWYSRIAESEREEGWENKVVGLIEQVAKQATANDEDLQKNWPFDDPSVSTLVDPVIEKEESVRLNMGEIHAWRVRERLGNNDVANARRSYEKAISVRPDPSEQNKQLRRDIVSLAGTHETRNFAFGRIEEMHSNEEVGLSTKFFLFRKGFYGGEARKALLMVAVILAALTVVLFLLRKLQETALQNSVEEDEAPSFKAKKPSVTSRTSAISGGFSRSSTESSTDQPQRKGSSGYKVKTSSGDEYSKLLAVFDLTDSASPEELKKAYRDKLKEYHPDTSSLDTEEANKKLDELKQVYGRIKEIQKSFFGGRRPKT